ncbi:hypothetical protein [Kiloniella antarctica]|uniref:Uncharacterized protein n=1 Tax=Kiloniella antarctica TaxID=1550907 RepID=A0ABW5BMW5_9PROT
MRILSEKLLKQAEKITEDKLLKNVVLHSNEEKAINRITRIFNSLNSANNKALDVFNADFMDEEVSKDIRLGIYDGDNCLYQKLFRRTHSKLKIISPESLKGYVGLLD